MKQTIKFYDFDRAFIDYRREENFSYEARRALFDYLEEVEEDTGEELELDVIALCCDWSEYKTALEAVADLSSETPEGDTDEEKEEWALEWLRDNGTVVEFDGGLLCAYH